jgi:hypothetical protein
MTNVKNGKSVVCNNGNGCTNDINVFAWKLRVLNEVKTCSSNWDLPKKIQCDQFYLSVFPTLSKYCATITKITDFTNHGT